MTTIPLRVTGARVGAVEGCIFNLGRCEARRCRPAGLLLAGRVAQADVLAKTYDAVFYCSEEQLRALKPYMLTRTHARTKHARQHARQHVRTHGSTARQHSSTAGQQHAAARHGSMNGSTAARHSGIYARQHTCRVSRMHTRMVAHRLNITHACFEWKFSENSQLPPRTWK